MRPKPHALIFDIDGTLIDSNELHVDSWDRSFRHFGKQFSRDALRTPTGPMPLLSMVRCYGFRQLLEKTKIFFA